MNDYKCKRCELHFCSEDEIPYCPSCECESLEELKDGYKPINKNTKIYKKNQCQKILNKGIISTNDEKFLLELIKNHPQYKLKCGSGISKFFIKKTQWNNNGFYLKRTDNTETDFSYIQCLNPRSKIQNIKTACRSAIAKDMMQISSPGYIAHHEIPFINIFNLWIKDKNTNEMEIDDQDDNCVVICFKDKKLSEDFRKFHNSISKIKKVTLEEHKKIHRSIKK